MNCVTLQRIQTRSNYWYNTNIARVANFCYSYHINPKMVIPFSVPFYSLADVRQHLPGGWIAQHFTVVKQGTDRGLLYAGYRSSKTAQLASIGSAMLSLGVLKGFSYHLHVVVSDEEIFNALERAINEQTVDFLTSVENRVKAALPIEKETYYQFTVRDIHQFLEAVQKEVGQPLKFACKIMQQGSTDRIVIAIKKEGQGDDVIVPGLLPVLWHECEFKNDMAWTSWLGILRGNVDVLLPTS